MWSRLEWGSRGGAVGGSWLGSVLRNQMGSYPGASTRREKGKPHFEKWRLILRRDTS